MRWAVVVISALSAEEEASQAIELHQAGRYQEAAQHFLRAYDISRNPTQLRNAAKSLEQAEFHAEALAQWERYLLLDIPEEKREEARGRIQALRGLLEEKRARHRESPADQPLGIEPVPAEIESHAVARWTVAGVGAAAVLGGVGLYLSGWATYWKHKSTRDSMPEVSRSDASAARLRSGFGIGLGAAGAATIVLAFLLLRDETKIAIVPTTNGALLAIDWP
jgi:tetratricopeptide (TPR) repeat protein